MQGISVTYADIFTHILVSLFIGYGVWKAFGGNKKTLTICLFLSLVTGILIDVDHLFEYFLAYGINFNYNDFMTGMMFKTLDKTYVVFHGYEYVAILGILILLVKKRTMKMYVTILTLSMLFHIFIDVYFANVSLQQYSILYRFFHGFQVFET